MTRHSPEATAVGASDSQVSGLHANFMLLTAFNDGIGKEILIELVDGTMFGGIFGGVSNELEIGLYCAEEKTSENEANLLPRMKDIVQKRQFAFKDIVCLSFPMTEEKVIKGFATDRDYCNKTRGVREDADGELQEWEGDGEDIDLEQEKEQQAKQAPVRTAATRNGGGWGVNEMFAANEGLGVTSTFNEDLTQYTTADIEGTDEDRKRAEKIAREIESQTSSRMHAALENDDEERDLDKLTEEFAEGDDKGKKYANRPGRPGPGSNRRAEGLKDQGRRPSNTPHQGPGGRGGVSMGSPQGAKNPTGGGYQKGRGHDGYDQGHDNSWSNKAGGVTKTFENRQYREQNKMLLENKQSPRPGGAQGGGGQGQGQGQSGSRSQTEKLRSWGNEFSKNYSDQRPPANNQPQRQSFEKSSPEEPEQATRTGPPPAATRNAWNQGPPTGLVSSSTPPKPSEEAVSPKQQQQEKPQQVQQPTTVAATAEVKKEEPSTSTTAANPTEAAAAASEEVKTEDTAEEGEGTGDDVNTTQSSTDEKKKFSFNPNAPSFTPSFRPSGSVTASSYGGGPPTTMGGNVMTQSMATGGAQPLMQSSTGMLQMPPAMAPQMQQAQLTNMQPILYSAPYTQTAPNPYVVQSMPYVINGGAIMPGSAGGVAAAAAAGVGPGGVQRGAVAGGPPPPGMGVPSAAQMQQMQSMQQQQGPPPQQRRSMPPGQQTMTPNGPMYVAQTTMAYQQPMQQNPFMTPSGQQYYQQYSMQQPMQPGPYMMGPGGQPLVQGRPYVPNPQATMMMPQQQYTGPPAGYGNLQQGPPPTPGGGQGGMQQPGQGTQQGNAGQQQQSAAGPNGSSSGGSNGHGPSAPPTPGPPPPQPQPVPSPAQHPQMYGMYQAQPGGQVMYIPHASMMGAGGQMMDGGDGTAEHQMQQHPGMIAGGYYSAQPQYYTQQPPPHMMRPQPHMQQYMPHPGMVQTQQQQQQQPQPQQSHN